jgi:uncharacterized membrane protein
MESKKRTSLKAICYTIYHVTIATLIFSGVLYVATGKWEYEYLEPISIGFVSYLAWEIFGYYIFERIWPKTFRKVK